MQGLAPDPNPKLFCYNLAEQILLRLIHCSFSVLQHTIGIILSAN